MAAAPCVVTQLRTPHRGGCSGVCCPLAPHTPTVAAAATCVVTQRRTPALRWRQQRDLLVVPVPLQMRFLCSLVSLAEEAERGRCV